MTNVEFLNIGVLAVQGLILWRQSVIQRQAEDRAQRHDRLSVRPYLDFTAYGGNGKFQVLLENHGTGPAIDIHLHIFVDGVEIDTADSWQNWPTPLINALGISQAELAQAAVQKGYLTLPHATLRPAGVLPALELQFAPVANLTKIRSRLRLMATYQSIYKDDDGTFSAEIAWPPVSPTQAA